MNRSRTLLQRFRGLLSGPLMLVTFSKLACGHPGHGIDQQGHSLLHYAGNPEHALTLCVAIAVIGMAGFAIYMIRFKANPE